MSDNFHRAVFRCLGGILAILATCLTGGLLAAEPSPISFDAQVADIFASRCLDCHQGSEAKGGLDLSRQAAVTKGGESGPALLGGQPENSLLWQRVTANEMPPKSALSAAEKELLRRWIAEGAVWGTDPINRFRKSSATRAGYDWWSLKPLSVPELAETVASALTIPPDRIDHHIHTALRQHRLTASPLADRRTLIRRLSFDLLGLPPTPEQVTAFLNDPAVDAYERLVDEFLASPHYGERWGRLWLDVARFGESQGFERDKLRENSWRYRDWVVQSLNDDLPYDEFARRQIAGDVLLPGDAAGVIATGFLVAGPYDEVGQTQQSPVMRAIVRQEELEDYVSATGQTFLGLTVHCARCHDHKFDPISQAEYYRLTADFVGVSPGEKSVATPSIRADLAQREATRDALRQQQSDLESPIKTQILAERKSGQSGQPPAPTARWTFDVDGRDSLGHLDVQLKGAAVIRDQALVLDGQTAYAVTAPLANDVTEKTLEVWVRLARLDQRGGGAISLQFTNGEVFDAITFGEREPGRWMAGSEGHRRYESWGAPVETATTEHVVHLAITFAADGTITGYRNGLPSGKPYQTHQPPTYPAQKSQFVFGLRHGTTVGEGRMFHGRIECAQFYDRALSPSEIAASAGLADLVTLAEIHSKMSPTDLACWRSAAQQLSHLEIQIKGLKSTVAYAVAPRAPEAVHLLKRGNPQTPDVAVLPGGIFAVGGKHDFGLAAEATDGERRTRLAEWITRADNPLFPRVMVNRIWHWHFGTGLVETPNDFGFNGGRPSHEELLNELAVGFVRSGFRMKPLHRAIVTSATYRQQSHARPECLPIDAGNRLLWRKSPVRLEAEILRDAVLSVAGRRNDEIGGPGYRDFRTFHFNSQFYEPQDPEGAAFDRRTIYRTWVRSGRSPFLDSFDCPDPSTLSPRRAVTTTPLQALTLLNSSFSLRMCDALAARVIAEMGAAPAQQTARLIELVYGRPAEPAEREQGAKLIETAGLPALCRVILNSNEWLYLE